MSEAMHELSRLSRERNSSAYDSLAKLRSIGRDLERSIREVSRERELSLKEMREFREALQHHAWQMARAGRVLSEATAWIGMCDRAAGLAWGFGIGVLLAITLGMMG